MRGQKIKWWKTTSLEEATQVMAARGIPFNINLMRAEGLKTGEDYYGRLVEH
jgi:hypothetical protein